MTSLPAFPPPGQRRRLSLPPGSADSLVLSGYGKTARLLVLTQTAQDAARLVDEIAWFDAALSVRLFPDWETLPYDPLSPHPDLVSERLSALWLASQGKVDVLVAPAATAAQYLCPPAYLNAHAFLLKERDRLDGEKLRARLAQAGYHAVNQVLSPGEFAVRGGIIDLYPMGTALPFRIDLFDDEVESIRTFDPDTQRTLYKVAEIRLLPAREVPLDDDGVTHFRQSFRDRFEGDPSKSQLYKDVSNKLAPGGVEYYLPLFFEASATLFDYLGDDTALVLHGDIQAAVENFWRDTQSRHRLMQGDKDRPLLKPEDLFLMPDAFFGALRPYARLELRLPLPASPAGGGGVDSLPAGGEGWGGEGLPFRAAPTVEVERKAENPYHRLQAHLDTFDGATLVVSESLGRRETLANALGEYGLRPGLLEGWPATSSSDDVLPPLKKPPFGDKGGGGDSKATSLSLANDESPPSPLLQRGGKSVFLLTTGPLAAGFIALDAHLAVITETELYARSPITRRAREARRATTAEGLLKDLSELKVGDPVVHAQHGIGRYYVPVSLLQLISPLPGRRSGCRAPAQAGQRPVGEGQAPGHAEQVRDTAAELLNLYALRAAREGHAFRYSPHDYEPSRKASVSRRRRTSAPPSTPSSRTSPRKPMDRLVCGDVGFGKTEVALRAAFVAVTGGKQVAVLAPHHPAGRAALPDRWSDRFADWPVKVAELSAFARPRKSAA
jgi:transcription-repair coupling factor (superfamily II helicase)